MLAHLFYKVSLPDKLPQDLQAVADKLANTKSREECLCLAYDILTKKYRGYHFRTYLKLHELFIHDLKKIWQKTGFLHCTTACYLLRVLLVKSGKFEEDDIQVKFSLVWYVSPHQYLRVRIADKKWVNVDIWYNAFGVGLGDYAHGFHA